MRFAVLAMTGAVALGGCATMETAGNGDGNGGGGAGRPVAIESESIRYETGPCFGTCPVYAVTIRPDGSGTFEGMRFTTVTGTREFQAGPAAYRRFAATLAPYRPTGERLVQMGTPDCGNAPTDMPSVDVRWSEMSGGAQHLNFYYGCQGDAMKAALRAAPDALPIAAFIRDAAAPR